MADVRAENISDINGNVNIAGRDIINNIQTIYERALTVGEVVEKDLQIEVNELARCVRDYLDRLKRQVANATSSEPYKGLEAYIFSESQIFFGRNRAIRDLYQAMRRGTLTILQAESGAGKTSLLQAGVIPRVIVEQHLAILIRPQFENPTQAIKRVFIGDLDLTPKLNKAPLVDFLRRVTGIIGYQTTLYLILDQFEEFFSKKTLEQDRQEFITDLAACLNDKTLNVRWVISITTNLFGQLSKFEPYIKNPFANVQSLYLFDRKQAADVIAKPAGQHGFSFEEGLLEQLLDDLDHSHNETIAPTQIQLVCAALYDDVKDQGTLFTRERYEQKGGAQGILHDYIANVLNRNLPPEERAAAYKVFEALITSEKKRVMRVRSELEIALKEKGISSDVLESTLDHLVSRRLLRCLGDDSQHLQYEIVHDYLLGEIELNEGLRNIKEAEELLEQGVRNWDKQQLLLAPDALKILESEAVDISISSKAAKLLFLSAIQYNRPAQRWMDLISAEDQKSLIDLMLTQKNNRMNREVLWYLRRHLTRSQKTRVTLTRSSLALLTSLQKAILMFLIAAAVLLIGITVVKNNKHFEQWTKVTSLDSQCLEGGVSSNLLVAIDAEDASRVVVYDPQSHRLCETPNSGAKWKQINVKLPSDLAVNSIAVNSAIYLGTDQGIYYLENSSTWRNLGLFPEDESPIERIAVASDRRNIYVLTGQDALYRYNTSTGKWNGIFVQGLTGKITDVSVNYEYRVVSTLDGIWYQKINPETQWKKYDFKSEEKATITLVRMVYPVKYWKYYFYGYDTTQDDWFLATTEKGETYSGSLTEPQLLQKIFTSPTLISSLAVNGYSKFSERSDGLYCEQTWLILDSEWWLRFGRAQPCK